jgi:hypothetical protein
MSEEKGLQTTSQILIYQAEDGQTKIEVQLQDETVWLTQRHMAELFQTSKQNIGQHLKNIFEEGELEESSVVKKFFTTAADGKRYQTSFYSLDAIISVGYRIKSHVATRFRQWATRHIKEFIIKGFVVDDEKTRIYPLTILTNCSAAFRTFAPLKSGSTGRSPIFTQRPSTMIRRSTSASIFLRPCRIRCTGP